VTSTIAILLRSCICLGSTREAGDVILIAVAVGSTSHMLDPWRKRSALRQAANSPIES